MGTDIHSVVQVLLDGKWVTVVVGLCDRIRSYRTFAVLAGVRNGFGFAGIRTGEPVTPIAPPRGLPTDFEVVEGHDHPLPLDLQKRDESVWMGDHSHSHLLLSEIQKYASARMSGCGYISDSSYVDWDGESEPWTHCAMVTGTNVVLMTDAEYQPYVDDDTVPALDKDIYIQVTWLDETYIPRYIEEMEAVAKKYNVSPSDVRLVFGFDS